MPELHRIGRGDRAAAQQQVHRRLEAGEPRQPLRATGTGQQAPAHFRHAELDARVVGHQPHPAGERELQPAAEREAVDGGDPRLGRGLEAHELAPEAPAHLEHLRRDVA